MMFHDVAKSCLRWWFNKFKFYTTSEKYCTCIHDNSKRNRSRNMKLEYIVVYENSLDKFNIDQGQGRCRPSKVSQFTTIQTVKFYNSTLVQARKLILSMYVYLILMYKIYEYCCA